MSKLNLFFALTKVDEAKREVYGIATAEKADKAGEICDYASTVPFYKKWSAEIEKASGGKSLGNVREMHDNKAVGKVTQLIFNDNEKQIEVCAKIVEESTWQKVLEGVLTGFSQGGSYAKQWKDPDDETKTRYTADPAEISVVDNPCLTAAAFELIRADGSKEMRKFDNAKIAAGKLVQVWQATDGSTHKSKQEMIKRQAEIDAEALAAPALKAAAAITAQLDAASPMYWDTELGKKDYSDAKRKEMAGTGEAMSDGSFPIKTAKDVENAVNDWGRTGSKPDVKAHIIRRAKAIDAEASLPDDWQTKKKKAAAVAELKKVTETGGEIFDVGAAIDALRGLVFLLWHEQQEVMRGDSEDAAQVTMLENAIDKIKEFVASEIQEEDDDEIDGLAAAAGLKGDLLKNNDKFVAALRKLRRKLVKAGKTLADHVAAMGDHLDKCADMHKAMMKATPDEMGDHLEKLGAHIEKMKKCHSAMENCMKDDEADKAAPSDELQKITAESDAQKSVIKKLSDTLEVLQKRLEIVEAQPLPAKGKIFAIEKGHEIEGDTPESVEAVQRSILTTSGLSPAEVQAHFRR